MTPDISLNQAVYPGEDTGSTTARHTLARFPTYPEAQRLVDQLSDDGFDVATLAIVGTDLRTVEQVTGRVTTARSALFGAGAGAWWGLFVGLLLSLFSTSILGPLLVGLVIGAVFGAVFGAAGHAALRGRRDFSSVQSLTAGSYEVMVSQEHAAEAERQLHG
ncbi:MAG: general stress protein [Mycobacteriales bacterium]